MTWSTFSKSHIETGIFIEALFNGGVVTRKLKLMEPGELEGNGTFSCKCRCSQKKQKSAEQT